MTILILVFLVSFAIACLIAPFIISFMKKQKAKQTILHYVEEHAKKQGTPTMGGIIFLIAIAITCSIFLRSNSHLALMSLVVTFAYALLGFLDDFLKVKLKQNLGLRAYQKIIFQLAIAIIVGIFVFRSPDVGTAIQIPFAKKEWNMGIWIIPFTILVFLACTNAVNLTDGLDGLATLTTFIYLLIFISIIIISGSSEFRSISLGSEGELRSLVIFAVATCGGLLAFLCYNAYPAKIFMGDTGSMALGAVVACVAIFSRTTLFIPIVGIVFVASALSVCIQVAYYKKTKRRVFLMAPLHHHFEKKGVHETKIVVLYGIITLMVGLVTLLFEFI